MGLAAKVVSTIAAALVISIAVRYLGPARYGVLATITSFLGLLQFTDLGIGNGLVARLAHARGRGDEVSAQQLVSATIALLLFLALVLMLVAAAALIVIDWPQLFGLQARGQRQEVTAAIAVCAALIAMGLPLGAVQDVQDGLQEGYATSSWAMAGSVLSVVGVALCALTKANLPFLVLSIVGGPVFALILNGYFLWGRRHPELRPSRHKVRRATLQMLLRSGGMFFVLQMAAAVGFETDAIVIARVLGAREVTNYVIPAGLFGFLASTVAVVVSPLWGAYADAIARRDYAWVRSTLRRSMLGVAAFTIPTATVLVIVAPRIIRWWAGPAVHTSWPLLVGLAIWAVLGSLGASISMLLNAAHLVRLQVGCASTMSLTNLGLSIVLSQTIGISGVVVGTVIAYVICVAAPYLLLVPARVHRLADDPDGV